MYKYKKYTEVQFIDNVVQLTGSVNWTCAGVVEYKFESELSNVKLKIPRGKTFVIDHSITSNCI